MTLSSSFTFGNSVAPAPGQVERISTHLTFQLNHHQVGLHQQQQISWANQNDQQQQAQRHRGKYDSAALCE